MSVVGFPFFSFLFFPLCCVGNMVAMNGESEGKVGGQSNATALV